MGITSLFHLAAAVCYCYSAYRCNASQSIGPRLCCYGAILSQFLALNLDDAVLRLLHPNPGFAIANCAMLTMLGLVCLDPRTDFPRSRRWLSLFASLASLLALYPHEFEQVAAAELFNMHVLLAVVAYGLFIVALAQMLEVWLLGRSLASHAERRPGGLSLLEMEGRVFRSVQLGFAILSLTILSGLLAAWSHAQAWSELNHETLFAWLTWLFCLVLLIGRWRWGWRGLTAVRWFMASVACLALNYIALVFVLDFIVGG